MVMLLTAISTFGQVIITPEDQGTNPRAVDPGLGVMVPMQNTNLDQFKTNVVPLGEGLLLLACLGGGFLLSKKVKGEN